MRLTLIAGPLRDRCAYGHLSERNLGWSFFGRKSSFSQMTFLTCPTWGMHAPCSLHAKQRPPPWRMGVFEWCHPIPENKSKEYVKNTQFSSAIYIFIHMAYYTLDNSLTLTYFMQAHYPIKIRIQDFQFAYNSPKRECPHRTSLLQLAKFIITIKNSNSPLRCHQTPTNIE
jgi:hypothetical protein